MSGDSRYRPYLWPYTISFMLEKPAETLKSPVSHRSFRVRFAREAVLFFVMKIGFVGLMFVISVMLTRTIGAAGFGVYVYVTTLINLLVVPGVLGLDQLLIREVSAHLGAQEWGRMRGLIGWTNHTSLRISLGMAAGSILVVGVLAAVGRVEREVLWAFLVSLIMLPLVSLTRLRQGTLRGLFRVGPSQLPEAVIQPILLLLLILVFGWRLVREDPTNVVFVTGLHVFSAAVAFLVGASLLRYYLPASVKTTPPTYNITAWRASAWPLFLYSSTQFMSRRVDTLLLGVLDGTEAVGVYTAVVRSTDLLAFVLVAINSVLAPTIVTLYKSGNMKRLQSVCLKSVRASLLITVMLAIPMLMFGRPFLMIFGSDFAAGQTALNISGAMRILSAAFGTQALILTMTGFEKDVVWGIGAGTLLNILLNLILIPNWGIVGAAIASTCGMLCWNIILTVRVVRRLGIDPTILGFLGRRHRAAALNGE